MLNLQSFKLAYMESWNFRLKQRLDELNLKPGDLAKSVGVAPAAITQWTNSTTKSITGENLLKACRALGVSPDWLMFGTGEKDARTLRDGSNLPPELQSLFDDLHRAWTANSLDASLISSLRNITSRFSVQPKHDMGKAEDNRAMTSRLGRHLADPAGVNISEPKPETDKNGELDAN